MVYLVSQQELNTVPETDDDELSVLGPLLDVVGHDGHVLEVQGCVNLVHHVQRRRLQTKNTLNCWFYFLFKVTPTFRCGPRIRIRSSFLCLTESGSWSYLKVKLDQFNN
jgi:hypothetical protein